MDPVKILPTEVFEKVLNYVDTSTLASCCLVSQKWNVATNNDMIWKNLCFENHWYDCNELKGYVERMAFLPPDQRHEFHKMGDWKKHYVLRNQVRNNWRLGNLSDFTLRPLESGSNWIVTCMFCDSDTLAFGFHDGVIKICDLRKEMSGFYIYECPVLASVDQIQISGSYLIALQHSYLLVCKFNDERTIIHTVCAKLIGESFVSNIEETMLMEIREQRAYPLSSTTYPKVDTIFNIDKDYLIFSTNDFSIDVYKLAVSVTEPFLEINWSDTLQDSRIKCLKVVDHVVYFVTGSDCDEVDTMEKIYLHAFSIESQSFMYVTFLAQHNRQTILKRYILETNEQYLVLQCSDYWTILVQRHAGSLLLYEKCKLFMDANGDPSMVGITQDYSLQINNPTTYNHYFCITLMTTPLCMFSDIIVTKCVEFDRDGVGSTQVEFWNINISATERSDCLNFKNMPVVKLLFCDHNKLIFYCEKDSSVVVRSFLK